MEIYDYCSVNHLNTNTDWYYLEDYWSLTMFELSEVMYHSGNGYDFLQEEQELLEWYDVNLII